MDAEHTVSLILTRGLPASGKSTWARAQVDVAHASGIRIARVNRDDLRRMVLPSNYSRPEHEAEQLITKLQRTAVEQLLCSGVSVIVDDTNLRMRFARDWCDLALRLGVDFSVRDFFDVSLETCLARDKARGEVGDPGFVGAAVIKGMHTRFLASGNPGPVLPRADAWREAVEPYVANTDLPEVILCDMDGTAALLNGRSPYDESCVSDDLPNRAVIDVVSALSGWGRWERRLAWTAPVIFLSARTEACREDTERWISKHFGIPRWAIALHMRAVGDNRPDFQVKLDIFNQHIRNQYNVLCVFDDRNQVVALWRRLGLTCFQVADGNF